MNEKLNKKLAEWAGYKQDPLWMPYHLEGNLYYDVRGSVIEYPPNFTKSLDACFKWLVPKLLVRIDQMFGSWVGWASIKGSHNWQSGVSKDNPALALCLAIEKLIDGEK